MGRPHHQDLNVVTRNLGELADVLKAHTTRCNWSFELGYYGDCVEKVFSTSDCVVDGAALGTHAHSRNDTLSVATLINVVPLGQNGRTNSKVANNGVGVLHTSFRRSD